MKNLNIIKKNQDFQKIIGLKNYKNSKSFVIYYRNNNNLFKYGVSVGKKLGNAVLRNYIKRVTRSIVYDLLEKFEHKKVDVVIIVKASFLELSYDENHKQLDKVLLSI
ncbi:ribonuclease P (protein C5) [Spiroplasma litorale]|uniref:Ribonuclease P protein component n=1 Tax=Spiroplasma litorale TaxID=216942 RepID=A0A0K1W3G5_9MOLU|nr:ribonuclease P protein component [Spiroplasma litorale]AKX34731.1 ribonuclease P (protein C5) [Spiroplasma litorale]